VHNIIICSLDLVNHGHVVLIWFDWTKSREQIIIPCTLFNQKEWTNCYSFLILNSGPRYSYFCLHHVLCRTPFKSISIYKNKLGFEAFFLCEQFTLLFLKNGNLPIILINVPGKWLILARGRVENTMK